MKLPEHPGPAPAAVSRLGRWLMLVLLCLALQACKQPVYDHLTEQEANEVLLTLLKGGVDAEKRAGEEQRFSVWVDESSMATALELLNANAQPTREYKSLGDVFARNGLVSSPNEERIRFIYAVEQELSRTLAHIDGVLVARVHVVLPASDPLSLQAKPASTSVFIKHRADVDMQAALPAIKDLVVRGIEGLTAEHVSVTFFPSRNTVAPNAQLPVTRFFGALVSPSSLPLLWALMGLPWVLAIVLLVALLRAAQIRQALAAWLNRRGDRRPAAPAAAEDSPGWLNTAQDV
ncbi:type III secretion inner membrane ring lipoprotein SctJ [Aquabacterium sp. A7-Y]|uniref:type III secretion system inner membrane ring lipoprotein SctJ n=1 Tax=Aquabacterium sp. A7-Y TaxID=1349605 RepID=UPI00223DAEA7|nr:type III secretion inner membrane ring lipoprotein SctJ [Aquabacterium sp. A7-Y]MCW7542114.1 type III secretion inner membrane ring lipoprotein SctJ [Aquabacterium sp. A7-Y]